MTLEGAPNFLAYLALAGYPLLGILLFALMPAARACAIVLVGGVMFLPPVVTFDAPLIPALGKSAITSLTALLGAAIFARRALATARPGRGYDLFVVALIVAGFFTTQTNGDPLRYGPVTLPGQTLRDFISDIVSQLLLWWVPFFLGRALLRRERDVRDVLVVLAVAGLVYSLFIWIEIRMSPQLNRWIYGFHQSEFLQTMRFGGFRPKVFMRHGLNVALFIVMSLLSATVLARSRERIRGISAWWIVLYLMVVLVVCKSAGALVYASLSGVAVFYMSAQGQARAAAVVAAVVFAYPLMRSAGWIPVEELVDMFERAFGVDRAGSLAFRFRNEELILVRALRRMWFGWGGYARPFMHDPDSGKLVSTMDGWWVITVGERGLAGFAAMFGLLLLPVWRLRHHLAGIVSPKTRLQAATMGVMAALYVFDFIPNSSIDPYLTFLAGTVAGFGRPLEGTPNV